MAKLLLNTDGKVLTSNDKVLKAPEGVDYLEQLLTDTLVSYSNDKLTKCDSYAFAFKKNLKYVDLPNVTIMEDYSVAECGVEQINLPRLVTAKRNVVYKSKITSLYLPELLETLFNNNFAGNEKLTEVYIPKVTRMGDYPFNGCYRLIKVYIEQNDSICQIGSKIFNNCYHFLGTVDSKYNPDGLKDGYAYVPASRLAEYKVATNWVTYASQIIGHQDFNVGDTLPNYTNETFTTQTWYSDETLTTVVTSVATAGKYYCRLEA